MAISDSSEVETRLLDDVISGTVDFKGRPSIRSKSGYWKSASFIIAVEVAERFAYYGISSNLISYLTGPMGQTTAKAAENVNVWGGTSLLLPLVGAFVADSFLGRYRTIIIASLIYILGLGFLSLSAAIHTFNTNSHCQNDENNNTTTCSPPPTLEIVAFFSSLYLVAIAQGGHKPCLQAFGADQFDDNDEDELKTKSSFFNWWYFSMNGGILVALLVLSYIQDNLSWELGFGIPCIVMCFALVVFLSGSRTYRFRVNNDETNPFLRIGRVFVKAVRNWIRIKINPTIVSIEDETRERFLDKDQINNVNDAKAILRLVPIWSTCLGFAIVSAQVSTLFTKQGSTMDRYITPTFQIPAASVQSLVSVSIIVFIPIYDRALVPTARALTKKPSGITMLQRIGTGVFLSFACMVIAALVERRRLATAIEYGLVDEPNKTVPMSVLWLAPQYLLVGVSYVFTMVGLQEFFYDQVPVELKSVGLAFYLCIFGFGNLLSSFMISVIEKVTLSGGHDSWFSNNLNRAHLDYFYWLLAGVSAVTMGAYVFCAKSYMYKIRER